ncbi:MAG TPA: NADH-quinone oxidoreductase subunit M [Candidatus Binatia bacterium]|nr:NADH-quinone oxidoreductase subunit M [Candidatus Binatia bacterium]
MMLNIAIFLPLITAAFVLLTPTSRPLMARSISLIGAVLTLAATAVLWVGFDPADPALQWRITWPWIPAIGASYDVAVDGLALPLIALTALLLLVVAIYVLPQHERAKEHAFFLLLMATGLIGLFSAQDLLLFYLFFEIALVPMYFIIGIWGSEHRRYAAIKFFLYTRAGSLAMLLSFLGLYLAMEPHTFSLPAIVEAQPLAGATPASGLVLLGMFLGFGVKLPIVPLHNWLPDAHVEAPTEGSVLLAGVLLKMGGFGFLRVMLPCLPDAARQYGWVLVGLALISLVYGALAALAQQNFKRLVAYTSINHMGYVMLGVAVWALSNDEAVKQLAINGATLQMVSHGLLTGGMFFMAGILQHHAGTGVMDRFGGLLEHTPVYSVLLGLLVFGSLGLPGLSGFIAEFQVIGASLDVGVWVAAVTVLSLIITTGLYIRVLVTLVMGGPPSDMPALPDLGPRELGAVVPLAILSVLIGILPAHIVSIIEGATRTLTHTGG